jgi:hypothetical protein
LDTAAARLAGANGAHPRLDDGMWDAQKLVQRGLDQLWRLILIVLETSDCNGTLAEVTPIAS